MCNCIFHDSYMYILSMSSLFFLSNSVKKHSPWLRPDGKHSNDLTGKFKLWGKHIANKHERKNTKRF